MTMFNDQVGIWRVAFPNEAWNKSKNHERGDVYDDDARRGGEHPRFSLGRGVVQGSGPAPQLTLYSWHPRLA